MFFPMSWWESVKVYTIVDNISSISIIVQLELGILRDAPVNMQFVSVE